MGYIVAVVFCIVLGLALMAVAALIETIPNLRFRRNARRFRCRLVSKETAIHYEGSDASIFTVELISPPEFAGKQVTATYKAWGRSPMYDSRGVRKELEQFEVGREYNCWFDPQRPEQFAMTPHPSWVLTRWTLTLGLALVLASILSLLGIILWQYSPP